MQTLRLPLNPLTREAFQTFGDVIDTAGQNHFSTNAGYAERFHDLAEIHCSAEAGKPIVSIFRARPIPLPLRIQLMERHPISSQAFIPLGDHSFIVIVADRAAPPSPGALRGYRTNGRQGINYHPGTWHHPLIALDPADFLVIDRQGPGAGHDQDYDEIAFPEWAVEVRTD